MGKTKSNPDVLIIEDTLSMALTYQRHLGRAGIDAEITQKGTHAISLLATGEYSLALLDLDLPDMNGLEVIKAVRNKKIPVSFIIVTANGSINTAIKAMKKGANDYLVKPVAAQRLITSVTNGLERTNLKQTVEVLKKDLPKPRSSDFIGNSPSMMAVFKMIESVAASKAPVFLTGESGTGKENCAQAIHDASPRSSQPFIAINCAAIPENLIESEIFGHVKGAFTGASEARKGAAREANGGTLFLDEICEMDINLQAKILRFLQTGKVKAVGSDKTEDVDVRVLCATNRNPVIEVTEGRFREDLFYRLDVLSIHLPPVRDRKNDVLELADFFMKKYAAEEGKSVNLITPEARLRLKQHKWPGNIREIQNLMRKIVVIEPEAEITADMIDRYLSARSTGSKNYQLIGLSESSHTNTGPSIKVDIHRPMSEIEQDVINAVIDTQDGSIPKASEILKLSPSTIYRKRESWEELKKSG